MAPNYLGDGWIVPSEFSLSALYGDEQRVPGRRAAMPRDRDPTSMRPSNLLVATSTTVTSLRQMPSPLGSICTVSQVNVLSGLLWSTSSSWTTHTR